MKNRLSEKNNIRSFCLFLNLFLASIAKRENLSRKCKQCRLVCNLIPLGMLLVINESWSKMHEAGFCSSFQL